MIEEFTQIMGALPFDRTGTIVEVAIHNATPVPEKTQLVKELNQIIKESADKFVGKDNLILMWSGGIDSTLALYALIDSGVVFDVLCTKASQNENPETFKELQSGKFKNVNVVYYDDMHVNMFNTPEFEGKHFITGELGDQCVGSDALLRISYEDRMKPWREKVSPAFAASFGEVVCRTMQTDDLTFGQLVWGLNFIFKYENVVRRHCANTGLSKDRVTHFFEGDDWQQWAMHHSYENTSFKKIQDYKLSYKKYIYSKNNDDKYFKYKIKIGSLKHIRKDFQPEDYKNFLLNYMTTDNKEWWSVNYV